MLEDDNSVFTAMLAGAWGYLLKGASHDEVLWVIGAVARARRSSVKPFRNRITNILSKLQVADRSEAIIKAREAGLG